MRVAGWQTRARKESEHAWEGAHVGACTTGRSGVGGGSRRSMRAETRKMVNYARGG